MNRRFSPGLSNRFECIQQWFTHTASYWVTAYLIVFLVTGCLTLKNYGLTWDEGLGNLFFGERYLHYFTSFQEVYLDFKADLPLHHRHILNLFQSPFRTVPQEFPPVADTLSAATMYLFSYRLGWLNPIDGFHLFTVLLCTLFLGGLYFFAAPRLGKFAALMAILFLGTFPRFWADMHFNVKDLPETVFFGLVILAFWVWYEKPHFGKALLVGLLWGLALGIKANAVFIPLILVTGIAPWSLSRRPWLIFLDHFKRYFTHYLVIGGSALIAYFASWPYLYANPFNNLKSYWSYIFSQGDRAGSALFNIDPLRQALTTMPELMLAALLIGLVLALRWAFKMDQAFWRVVILWAIFPILRASMPGAVNFDGIRHFMEFVPAAALLAGWGTAQLVGWLSRRRFPALAAQSLIVLLLAANLIQINLTYYPYLHIYYNQLTGGLSGARNGWLGLEAGDYWASSYRQGLQWLSQHSPPGSSVHAMAAGWIVDLSAPLFLRPDIKVMSDEHLPDFNILEKSAKPIYLMFILREGSFMDELAYCQKRKTPVYEIKVDQVPILQIFEFGQGDG